jgi:hypothetical protein
MCAAGCDVQGLAEQTDGHVAVALILLDAGEQEQHRGLASVVGRPPERLQAVMRHVGRLRRPVAAVVDLGQHTARMGLLVFAAQLLEDAE